MAQKKGGRLVPDDTEKAHAPLQAILLADSFAQTFRPITLERPKVLLPLVNTPMIDYALAWLESAGVEEVYVFCCAHSKQVIEYLEKSEWLSIPKFMVTTIEKHNVMSAGDALREIYERDVIQGDFVLISGDTVSNMSLMDVLQEHKERRKKDPKAVMTMVVQKSKPCLVTHQTRLGNDELFMAINHETKQLLCYEDAPENLKGLVSLDNVLLADNAAVSLHSDKQDCYIDICSPEVLSLFCDNFDYQHLRRHFVKGLLLDDIMGYQIFTHEIHSSYAARVDNFRSYDTISKDIMQRWTYPLVPDVLFSGSCETKLERQGIYKSLDVEQSRSAQILPYTFIGKGTIIGDSSKVINSVIGKNCIIGSNVSIEGSYIWDNVIIEDGCKLLHTIVCDGVIIKPEAVLEPGVVVSFEVIIGEKFVIPAYSMVSLLSQPSKQDSDEELEYADSSSGVFESLSMTSSADVVSRNFVSGSSNPSEVGDSGAGYIWSVDGGHEEEWRHSVAPIHSEKLIELIRKKSELDLQAHDGSILPPSGKLQPDWDSDSDCVSREDPYVTFEREVEETFLRTVHEGVDESHVMLEVKSLRLSYNMETVDCASAIFQSVMKLALKSQGELYESAKNVIVKWRDLLKQYIENDEEEVEVILKFEEMCLESAREFSPIFAKVLAELYDKDVLSEEAILSWALEKEGADESDKSFLKQSELFIKWLKEAEEEE